MRIDSHQHFWNYDPEQHGWMNSDMTVLKQDYAPKDIEPLLASCNLDGCVAVQASQTEKENEFLLALCNNSSVIKGIVGWTDLQSEKVAEQLTHYKQFEKIKGFRHIIQDEPDIDFMLRPAFLKGIKQLKSFDYTYDILIFPKHLPNTLTFIKQFPDQPFVIDHIAKPQIRNGQFADWKENLGKVASFKNVYCKISGMVTEAVWNEWKAGDFTKYLDAVVELFGTGRIMYGSDWPVCTLSSSYMEQYNIVCDYFAAFSSDEQHDLFGGNAKRFYNL